MQLIDEFAIFTLIVAAIFFGVVRLLNIRATLSQKASLSDDILQYGDDPSAFVNAAWSGSDYTGLDEKLDSWAIQIRALAQLHNASPFLHDHPKDLPIALAVLDDALSILMRCAPSEDRPDGTRMRNLRGAINDMLDTLKSIGLAPTTEVPARPVFPPRIRAHLDRVGFESEGEFILRRSLLLAWVRYDGRGWYDDQATFRVGETIGKKTQATQT